MMHFIGGEKICKNYSQSFQGHVSHGVWYGGLSLFCYQELPHCNINSLAYISNARPKVATKSCLFKLILISMSFHFNFRIVMYMEGLFL